MEEEELQLKEVEREVVTEVMVPQVKTLYRYQGQGMGFEKGEVREEDLQFNITWSYYIIHSNSCVQVYMCVHVCGTAIPYVHTFCFVSAFHLDFKDQQGLVVCQVREYHGTIIRYIYTCTGSTHCIS